MGKCAEKSETIATIVYYDLPVAILVEVTGSKVALGF